jgi:spermidine/putrescine transport system permease protein
MHRVLQSHWLSFPPVLYLLTFFAVPALIMVGASLSYPGDYGGLAPLWAHDAVGLHLEVTGENYQRLFTDWIYLKLFVKSIGYALATTMICLAVAYPVALMIARSRKKFRDFLIVLVILPFWSNFLIRIYAWMILLGPQAGLNQAVNALLTACGMEPVTLLFSPAAVLFGLVYVHLPFMILPLYANLERHDPCLLDAAQDLGANARQRFWHVTFPLSLPGVYAGAVLVFIPALGAFAVPDILGGTEGFMIGNLISQQFLAARDWPFGSALSMVLTMLALCVAFIVGRISFNPEERP